jgi:hypothetical protein
MPRSGCSWRSRATSSRSVVFVCRERAPERALDRAAQLAERLLQLVGAARRASSSSGWSPDSASETPNSRWITLSCSSRARSIRASS